MNSEATKYISKLDAGCAGVRRGESVGRSLSTLNILYFVTLHYKNVKKTVKMPKKHSLLMEYTFSIFFGESILGISKMDKKNVQKSKSPKRSCKKYAFVTIIDFFGLGTKKIFFNLLP